MSFEALPTGLHDGIPTVTPSHPDRSDPLASRQLADFRARWKERGFGSRLAES